jgi:hypothetical protein
MIAADQTNNKQTSNKDRSTAQLVINSLALRKCWDVCPFQGGPMKKHEQAGIDPRQVAAIAKMLAKKSFMAHLKAQGHRISLTPLPLARLHKEWLESHGDKFYVEARQKIERWRAEDDRRRNEAANHKAVGPTGPRISLGR